MIANRTRLAMFGALLEHPGLNVSAVAERLEVPCCVASQYLRSMEARGLLVARRLGRTVEYRIPTSPPHTPQPDLAAALRTTFAREEQPIETAFQLVTAFTHLQRIEIYRRLRGGSRTAAQLQTDLGLSEWAVRRHLEKLERRGFVRRTEAGYEPALPSNHLGGALAKAAAA